MDDLTHIMTFCRTVETGSITDAAKSLHLTKSVASRRITALEENLGVSLLKRSPRGAVATEAGELYYARSREILDRLEDARQQVSGLGSDLVGRVRMTAPRSLSDLIMNRAYASFLKENPGVELDLNLDDRTVDLIGEGYDLALRVGTLKDSSLIGRKLTDLSRAAVASPEYLAVHGTPKSPSDLQHHTCIFYSNMEARAQWRFTGPTGDQQSVKVQGRISTNSGQAQMELACAGLGIAVLPQFFIHQALTEGRLQTILTDYTQNSLGIYALYPPSRQQNAKVRALVDHLKAYCQQPDIQCCF